MLATPPLVPIQTTAVARATGVAVSRDGRTVVVRAGVGSLGALAVFRTGSKVVQVECVARNVRRCADGRGLETPSAVAFSPDGRNAYVTAQNGRSLGVYARTAAGKLVARGSVQRLLHPYAVAASPDGRNVYVGGARLWVLTRDLQVVQTLPAAATALAISPDGATVYAGAGGGAHGTLTAYARDPATGKLTQSASVASPAAPGIEQPVQLVATAAGVYALGAVSGAVARFDPGLRETAIARGLPRATGLAVAKSRVYVGYRWGIAAYTTALRHVVTRKLLGATGVAAWGSRVYAVSPKGLTVFRR